MWPCDPHTLAKHDLLRLYLQSWLPTLLHGGWPGVTYAEGFAGAGVYSGGQPGSPIIALDVFLGQRALLAAGKRVDMVLVEERNDRMQQLKHQVGLALARQRERPRSLQQPIYRHGDSATELLPGLAVCPPKQPVFAFLDSFGGPDIPFEVVQAIARRRASEVLITFSPRFLTRFGERDIHRDAGNRAFGGTHWQNVFEQPSDQKKRYLVTAYRTSLNKAGFGYVVSFEMLDETGNDLHLVFGTSSPEGLAKMKNAMWQVDPVSGLRYRDPRDPDQTELALALEPNTAPLRRAVLGQLNKKDLTLDELRRYALLETIYRREHVQPAVLQLLKSEQIERVTKKGRLTGSSRLRLAPQKGDYEVPTLF